MSNSTSPTVPTIDRAAIRASVGSFRPDIEGLRALAVILVMANHATLPLFSGGYIGVDVFFVISGFLITKHLVGEVERTGRISYVSFYARRVRRLLPASALVLVAVTIATWAFLPPSVWSATSWEVAAAGLFVANWVFAARATDYFASDALSSPAQHFWSLSVEEQFYFLWPALLGVAAGLVALRLWHLRTRMGVALGLVFFPSLLWSLFLTESDPARSYFVTTTRLWELALGGLVAIAWPWFARLSRNLSFALGWVGLAAIFAGAVLFSDETVFPGAAALLPTFGAAFVIVAGAVSTGDTGAAHFLGKRPLVWVGGLSYSLYLWHWPFVVFAPFVFPGLGAWFLVVAVTASVVPAWLSFKLVEKPVRASRQLRESNSLTMMLGVSCLVVVVTGAGLLQSRAMQSEESERLIVAEAAISGAFPGAAAAYGDVKEPLVQVRTAQDLAPSLSWVEQDTGRGADDVCKTRTGDSDLVICDAGDPGNPIRVVLVGDSHALHWFPALEEMANDGSFYLQQVVKTACPFTETGIASRKTQQEDTVCSAWQDSAIEFLRQDPPDVVISSSRDGRHAIVDGVVLSPEESGPAIAAGMVRVYEDLAVRGVKVVHLADTPLMSELGSPPDCVRDHIADLGECTVSEEAAFDPYAPSSVLKQMSLRDVKLVDMRDGFCDSGQCRSVIGNVIVFRDEHHMTQTYARSLGPYLYEQLRGSLRQSRAPRS